MTVPNAASANEPPECPLTYAELECIALAADGLTNQQIATARHCVESTVKALLQRAYRRLNTSDRAHAVATALRNEWIP